ncbi:MULTISPECIES: SHOCT domain-containing protein [Clostridium]|uniref:SHOCT domain-containing protein n=1 Tax=Clostridium frigoriphilum TaxID=443253 RepID=A0ABU7UQ58_9CLOT|nr:SHOCT domain-containing protein [Clostridium sp. DSM 17811]MBU3100653.1 hypothetical protein [Clostridium sp. DSM 17811]
MTQQQFQREKNYRVSIAIAKVMISRKLITAQEYSKIDSMLVTRYRPVFGGL